MLFRGDGKSKIYNIDFFSNEATSILNDIKPSIGFINPPYGGKDNKTNPYSFIKDKDKNNLTEINQIFLVTILKQLSSKYGYGRQVRIQRLVNETIKLPIDKINNINWVFIENYIKSLPYSKNLIKE